LVPYDGVDQPNRRGELVETTGPPPQPSSFGPVAVKCLLRNTGTGPAISLKVRFRFLDMNGWTTVPWELMPLAAGETRGGEGAPLLVPVWVYDGSPFNTSDFADVPNKQWEIWLEYQDVFGREFCSVHHRRPIRQEDGTVPVPDAPEHMMYPAQPWVSFPDIDGNER
jgi:hypothetical protein